MQGVTLTTTQPTLVLRLRGESKNNDVSPGKTDGQPTGVLKEAVSENPYQTQPNDRKVKVLCYLKAIKCLLDIKDTYEPEGQESPGKKRWDDLSQNLFTWIDQLSDYAKSTFIPSTKAFNENLNKALKEIELRVDNLAKEILLDPMGETILDSPLLEEDGYIWSASLLKKCQSFSPHSPYTQKPFKVEPHLFAQEILDWGNKFFPSTFNQEDSEDTEMDAFQFKLIQKNATAIIEAQNARSKRKKVESDLQALSETVKEREQTNFQRLLQRNLRVESQIRQEGVDECVRLNQRLLLQGTQFAQRQESLESDLGGEKQKTRTLRKQLIALEIKQSMLENQIERQENEICGLRQMIHCAQERINQCEDGGGDCSVM